MMLRLSASPAGAVVLFALALLPAAPAQAAEGPGLLLRSWNEATDRDAWKGEGYWRLAIAPYAPHFRPSDEHQDVFAVALERQRPDDWLAGFSAFSNSFGQPSAYAYVGRRHPGLMGVDPLFFQWSVGVLYGYVGKYKSKVALNVGGFAPGALVGLGWQFNRNVSANVHLMGDAGVMFQFSWNVR
jgi:hypothetical protein